MCFVLCSVLFYLASEIVSSQRMQPKVFTLPSRHVLSLCFPSVSCRCLQPAVAMAIMGGYGGLYMLFKMKSAMTKKAPVKEVAPATSSAPSGGIPSIESDEFGDWLGSDAFNAYVEKA